MQYWIYGVAITQDGDDHVVSVRDLPEVVTSGDTLAEALELAADGIEVIVEGRMADEADLSPPSPILEGEHTVPLPASLAAKAAVYSAWKAAKMTKSELARRLGRNDTEVGRILDPRHGTKLDQLEEAAKALGKRLVVAVESA
jgi:antitoxin HicB